MTPTSPSTAGAPIAFIGEAKYRDGRPGLAELRRLEHVRALLVAAGHDARAATFGLFSGTGFAEDLAAEDLAAEAGSCSEPDSTRSTA